MTDVYTHTLASGQILVVSLEASFGDLIMAGSFLLLFVAGVVDFVLRLVYRD